MSIPLNIDWQQILLHLFNFVILSVGLYILLYKPVCDFMNKRKAYFEDIEKEAEQKLETAENLNAEYSKRLAFADEEIAEIRANAIRETEIYRKKAIEKTEKEAEFILSDAKSRAEKERKRIIAEAKSEIAESAIFTAEKIIRKNIDENCMGLFDDMLRKMGENCGK